MNNLDNNGSQAVNRSATTFCSLVSGMHVICTRQRRPTDAKWERRGVRYPVAGTVYTIRSVGLSPDGRPYVLLKEIVNPVVAIKNGGYQEAFFNARKFRPLKKLKIEDFMPVVEHLTDEVRA